MKKLFMSLLAVASIGIAGFANAQETAAQSELGSIDATITTAKGGVVIGISDQFKIPVRYIGLGEQMTDLQVFDRQEFVESLLQTKKI